MSRRRGGRGVEGRQAAHAAHAAQRTHAARKERQYLAEEHAQLSYHERQRRGPVGRRQGPKRARSPGAPMLLFRRRHGADSRHSQGGRGLAGRAVNSRPGAVRAPCAVINNGDLFVNSSSQCTPGTLRLAPLGSLWTLLSNGWSVGGCWASSRRAASSRRGLAARLNTTRCGVEPLEPLEPLLAALPRRGRLQTTRSRHARPALHPASDANEGRTPVLHPGLGGPPQASVMSDAELLPARRPCCGPAAALTANGSSAHAAANSPSRLHWLCVGHFYRKSPTASCSWHPHFSRRRRRQSAANRAPRTVDSSAAASARATQPHEHFVPCPHCHDTRSVSTRMPNPGGSSERCRVGSEHLAPSSWLCAQIRQRFGHSSGDSPSPVGPGAFTIPAQHSIWTCLFGLSEHNADRQNFLRSSSATLLPPPSKRKQTSHGPWCSIPKQLYPQPLCR